jgi:hypothetical protein
MKICLLSVLLLLLLISLQGISFSPRNQLALTVTRYLEENPDKLDIIGYWQPELNVSGDFGSRYYYMGQFTGTLTGRRTFKTGTEEKYLQGKVYRLWAKLGTTQTEVRLGLQRLNFGSAMLLRPLQWFDSLDPTDVLQKTEGVQALLLSHYFLNNANVWLWGIRGEGKQRGEILTVTKEGTPEIGGRLQYPLPKGEIALTANYRFKTEIPQLEFTTGTEKRIGLDVKYDLGIGLWAEGYVSSTEKNDLPFVIKRIVVNKYQAPFTIGADYTLSVGNGIYILAEAENRLEAETELAELRSDYLTYAFTANYPLNILDTVYYYGTVRDDNALSTHTLIWRRTYDHLGWDLGIFWDGGTRHTHYNSRGVKALLTYTF